MNANNPINSMENNEQKIRSWLNRLRTNKLLLIGVIVGLCLVVYFVAYLMVYLINKFTWFEWLYVLLSILSVAVLGICVCKLLLKQNKSQQLIQGAGQEAGLEFEIESLRSQNESLHNKIDELNGVIRNQTTDITRLEQKMGDTRTENSLENKYMDILILLQNLNICVEDLSNDNADFVNVTKREISGVLSLYGYLFKEYSQDDERFYDCEIYDIESPQIVRRAIVNKNGELIVKGKIYIPKEYGR